MDDQNIADVVHLLKKAMREIPFVSSMAEEHRGPFPILISTILSLRTKDEVTAAATERLFTLASTPEEMLELSEEKIIRAIYPVGFYRNKAKTILHICRELIGRFNSQVPDTVDELQSLKGVGRKTANLVVTLGYRKEGICVDTHVHRISNRLGYVRTKTPEQTEYALREKLPLEYWSLYNTLMVAFGRNICRPISPFCGTCPVSIYCDRVGVTRSR
ncbi:MAG: endonuclease III [Syntrophaceae bacterium CG2_30_49_12]|nr:MAG: endonuclease III [Syntrophaceae bacterium CG2_30_49_12]PIP05117.1 MAG: endonuclease III [Syntrophobacterales bacterium CG23_combo_of_CG06-09_8_20_14_all_48_27]PJA49077.1 MAG: endonuclease III [Syntrophobacterales bacterium CG_4_9_14_3_um_filter_49_8]PJC75030.1 MAG: endonuclease III [Syntrophobacterales bacterium CG_4_8_14_3_um_filter_49_14]